MEKEIEQLKLYTDKIEQAYTDATAELIELKIENEQQKIEMLSLHSHSKCPCKDELIKIRQIVRSIFKNPGAYAVTDGTRGEKVNAVLEICDRLIKIQNQISWHNTCSHKNFVTTKLGRSCIECNHNALHGIREETGEEFLRRAESYSILEVK